MDQTLNEALANEALADSMDTYDPDLGTCGECWRERSRTPEMPAWVRSLRECRVSSA